VKYPESLLSLPIFPCLDEIADALLSSPSSFLVLTAETAAGKSTAVPLAFLDRVPGRIVMLEPRRLATIAIADRISSLLGESSGGMAGYRVHLDSKVSERTRIEIITEAILTRRIQNDPSLSGISVVILDEFHERSVHTDLALALLKDIMSLRDDLYVIVMSATIDTGKIAAFLDAPVLSVPGRRFPVSISYAGDLASRSDLSVAEKTARAVLRALESPGGSILAFLPGLYEISRARELLDGSGAEVLVLHSSVPLVEQRQVLSAPDSVPGSDGKAAPRRVILSSSIAETSLTVPGVSVVIDSGLSRTVRFNVATGMDRLVTETESEFQATQRAGRAGRLGPGSCIRLWAERDVRVSDTPPEITRTDILPLVLECALWGVSSPSGLDWLDPPNEAAWQAARELLASLGATEGDASAGRIAQRGKLLASLGVHPRIAAVAFAGETELAAKYGVRSDNPRELERFRADLERRVASASKGRSSARVSGPMALLEGFPDRIARHTVDGVYQFPSGRLASLPQAVRKNTARPPEWIVAPEVDAGEREGRIYSFEELPSDAALAWLELRAKEIPEISFSGGTSLRDGKPIKTVRIMYGKIVLSERRAEMTADDVKSAVCASIRKTGLSSLPWSESSSSFLVRARFALRGGPAERSRAADDDSLSNSLEDWLVPFLPANGMIGAEALLDALRYRLDGAAVDRDAPSRITLANGLSRPLTYEEIAPGEGPVPVLETRIQDLYGCPDTPRVSGLPVLVRLLSPAGRPMQITRDLAGFWKGSWADVRKDMRGRYPKHDWPENPAQASPPQPRRPPPTGAGSK
jgi:ATP-dependent helicase HrpB